MDQSTTPKLIFLLWLSCLVLFLVVSGLPQSITHRQAHLCATLTSLSLQNTVIWEASHVPAFSHISDPGLCHYNVVNAVDFCRVYGEISTSSVSSVRFEVWLPDTWYGRLLSTGNLGLGGCIDYGNLVYASSLNFATVAGNGGHVEPNVGSPFYHHPEVVKDFSYRSVHITTVIGKQIAEAYYSKFPSTSYYLSCSNGGRQGVQSALLYPDDFDGIIAGSPALDWNHFIGSGGITADYVGPPGSDRFIPSSLWPLVTREVLKQCDELDGLPDGTVAEPDDCRFDPSPLTCADGQVGDCLTETQTEGLRMLYRPIYGSRGQFLWPRFDPDAELDTSLGGPMDAATRYLVGFVKSTS